MLHELKDIPIFQEWKRQGTEEGKAEGRAEGLESLRSMLVELVAMREPELAELVALIDKPKVLRDLTLKVVAAKTTQEMQDYLLNWQTLFQQE